MGDVIVAEPPDGIVKGVAMAVVAIITGINCISARWATRIQVR